MTNDKKRTHLLDSDEDTLFRMFGRGQRRRLNTDVYIIEDVQDDDTTSDFEPSQTPSEEDYVSDGESLGDSSQTEEEEEPKIDQEAQKLLSVMGKNIFDNIIKKYEDEDYEEEEEYEDDTTEKYLKQLQKQNLSNEDYSKYAEEMKSILDEIKPKEPNFLRVLRMNIPKASKVEIISKLEELENTNSNDTMKLDSWINSILKVPFGNYKSLGIDHSSTKEEITTFLTNMYKTMDNAVFGHSKVKEALMEIVSKRIMNPDIKGQCIAIVGDPGVGKTEIIRNGLAKAMNLPFVNISMAGISDESHLTGFSYTYEGARYGRICQSLIDSKVMNPVFFMDELDKIDTQNKGMSVVNKLIELTDFTQNSEYEDQYFSGIKLDLSKCTFVFTLNDINLIDPVLRDRLEIIRVDGFNTKEKKIIAQKYLLPKELKNNNLTDVNFSDKTVEHIVRNYGEKEKGVRQLKNCLEKLCRKINILKLMDDSSCLSYSSRDVTKVTPELVDKLLSDMKTKIDPMILRMYS